MTVPNAGACGIGGQQCLACSVGQQCENGRCLLAAPDLGTDSTAEPCGPSCLGCCDPVAGCVYASNPDRQCGIDSSACVDCTPGGLRCVDGQCKAIHSTTQWDVRVISAKLDPVDGKGEPWDTLLGTDSAPDPFVLVAPDDGTYFADFTESLPNTTTPRWDEVVVSYTTEAIENFGIVFEVRDQDLGALSFETMGTCRIKGHLSEREVELTRQDRVCNGAVEWLKVQLTLR